MLIRLNAHGDFADIFQSFDNFLQQTTGLGEEIGLESGVSTAAPWPTRKSYPAVESFRRGENYVLRVELPGVNPEEIETSVEDGHLILKGEKKQERSEEDKNHYLCEVAYGRFQRSFRLPRGVKAEQLKARHENGVLTVTIPARSPEDVSRRVPIQISVGTQASKPKTLAQSA
jgi:HSP20 family protein